MVRIIALHKQLDAYDLSFSNRAPGESDKATIIEIYEKPTLAYEYKCSNKKGITEWLLAFRPSDADFENVTFKRNVYISPPFFCALQFNDSDI